MKYIALLAAILVIGLACDDNNRVTTNKFPPLIPMVGRFEYQEIITSDSTFRFVTAREDSADGLDNEDDTNRLVFEFRGEGNSDFETSLSVLDFEHTLLGIEPSPLPDGKIRRAKLDLKFIERSGRFVQAGIDSIEFEKAQRKLAIVDVEDTSWVEISETLLADGILKVDVSGLDGQNFKLKESIFRVYYQIPE